MRWTTADSGYSDGAQDPDDEVVVVLGEAVAGQADVVRHPGLPEGLADAAVLGEDGALLLLGKLLEGAGPAQGIPDRPGQLGAAQPALRPGDERLLEVGLPAHGVGAAEHRVLFPRAAGPRTVSRRPAGAPLSRK